MRIRTRVRLRSRVRKILFWGTLLFLTVLAGGLCLAYVYVTDGTNLAALIESEIPRYLPGSRLILGKVKVRPFMGELDLPHISLQQVIDGVPFQAARIP